MMEICITPARRRSTARRRKKTRVLRVRHLVSRKLKTIHPHTMHRLLIIAPVLATHPKPSLRDAHHLRLDDRTLRPAQLCPTHPRRRCHTFFLFLPHAEAAEEGIFIASKPGAGRQLLPFLAVSTAQDDEIGFQSIL